jgi:RNAse (barnase) inhibitor barstar
MAWQVAIVVDPKMNLDSLRILIGQMPVWALAMPERKEALHQLNEEFDLFWTPDPAFTVFTGFFPDDPIGEILNLIPIIEEHHSRQSGLSLFGLNFSPRLQNDLSVAGYQPVPDPDSIYPDRLRFAKPISSIQMPQIFLDASDWKSCENFYQSFFAAVGAPSWHGRNFNALDDSIGEGGINAIEVPYRITIQNADSVSGEVAAFIRDFDALIKHLQSSGCPVDLVVEQSS